MEKQKLNIVLADKDGFYLQKLKTSLERKGRLQVVGLADNGIQAMELIRRTKPDVVVMDILLGERDGFWVLEQMQKEGVATVSIMVSAIVAERMVRQAMQLGASYFMAKPIQGDLLLQRISQLSDYDTAIVEEVRVQEVDRLLPEASGTKEHLEAEISAVLSKMGIPASIKGYHYIRKAVMMSVEDESVLVGITKGLYPDIAKLYKTSASKVERAIRHAIESAWKKNGQQVYFELAGFLPLKKPTNGQFIAAISEYFRLYAKKKSNMIA